MPFFAMVLLVTPLAGQAMPRRHHVAEIAPEQPAIDDEEGGRGTDPCDEQRDIDGQHHQVDQHHAGGGPQSHRDAPG